MTDHEKKVKQRIWLEVFHVEYYDINGMPSWMADLVDKIYYGFPEIKEDNK